MGDIGTLGIMEISQALAGNKTLRALFLQVNFEIFHIFKVRNQD
jgi:hypothetical protein